MSEIRSSVSETKSSVSNIERQPGYIHVIIGPMFSGKTTELFRLKKRAEIAGNKCLLIKYQGDHRYDDMDTTVSQLSTHDSIKIPAMISQGHDLQATINHIPDLCQYNSIYIDEVQFYPNGAEICDELANQGFEVVVSGLQGTWERRPFGCMSQLLSFADKITHLTAMDAQTGQEAPFTARMSQDKEEEVIGGTDKYQAVDRSHYNRLFKNKLS